MRYNVRSIFKQASEWKEAHFKAIEIENSQNFLPLPNCAIKIIYISA